MDEPFIRLQKFLAMHCDISRRKAEEFIKAGKVFVNKKVAVTGEKVNGSEKIVFLGKQICKQEKSPILIAFNKPEGVECTYEKNVKTKTLNDFHFSKKRLFPIGRLDKNSKGLLLLTNDGALANKLMHPKFQHEKEYFVVVNKKLHKESLKKLREGSIFLDKKKVQPCVIRQISGRVFTIILKEGRNRQIRRMCEASGLIVKELLRTRIGSIQLGKLSIGSFRTLRIEEVRKSFKEHLKNASSEKI